MTATERWSIAGRELDLESGLIVGVLNVTPDSFSSDGFHQDVPAARDHALRLADEGAGAIDVGGESTRPGAEPVSLEAEVDRVLPVVGELLSCDLVVSVDTSEPELAQRALSAGAHVINDVTGFGDPAMVEVVSDFDCGLVVMSGSRVRDGSADVVDMVRRHLLDRVEALVGAGVAENRLVIDPGLGFGKTPAESLRLVAGMGRLSALGIPIMVGASRKGFLSGVISSTDTWESRDRATATINALSYLGGARVFRVHDVAHTRDALGVAAAIVAHH